MTAISFNNVYYMARRPRDRRKANRAVKLIRRGFDGVPVDGDTLDQAIDSSMKDFEDAIQRACALKMDLD